METVSYTMEVPKEIKEVIDLLDGVLSKIMDGESVSSFMSLFDELYAAVEGVKDVGIEMKSSNRDEAAGYLVHKLLATLLPVPISH